jgi:uncharacterized LabA/DUF88 family protein
MSMSDQKLKIAVFIDFDNVEIGVKSTLGLPFDIGAVLEAIKERGEVVTKIAYGDWKRSGDYGRAMSNHAVRLVQRVMTPGGDKNGADINLALDALEMAFTHAHINAFVIVGGDSDFITLVEKLKQYDRKVFVVGGRSFTSQVMQKNCTEFIAYENVVPDRRAPRAERGDRPRVAGTQHIDGAVPLVKRALKLLADREVTPQLGLLKSTLLQLDSSFSERDYGSGTFRDFADKLASHGLVSLKHQGRSTLVELVEGGDEPAPAESHAGAGMEEGAGVEGPPVAMREVASRAADGGDAGAGGFGVPAPAGDARGPVRPDWADRPADAASLADGVALVRRVLANVTTEPRWPMYPRQFKQFLRSAEPSFDERRYGSIAELMRACQKDGLLKLERDRQGGLRVFAASGSGGRMSVPHGWSILAGGAPPVPAPVEETGEGPELAESASEPLDAREAVEAPEAPAALAVAPAVPLPAPAGTDELPDDDIGNRIGGAADVTRETIGGYGSGGNGLAEDPPRRARRTRKTPAGSGAARRPAARRKKTT